MEAIEKKIDAIVEECKKRGITFFATASPGGDADGMMWADGDNIEIISTILTAFNDDLMSLQMLLIGSAHRIKQMQMEEPEVLQ